MSRVEFIHPNNLIKNMNTKKTLGLIALLAGAAGSLTAGDLTSYATGDVLVCFRNASTGYDLVVDVGPVGTFTGYAANSRHTVTGFTLTQLQDVTGAAYGTSFNWSAFTYLADGTLYLTRSNLNAVVYSQTTPVSAGSYLQQSAAAQNMFSITRGVLNFGVGGAANSSAPYSDSSATAVITDDGSDGNPNFPAGLSYHDALFAALGTPTFNGYISVTPEISVPSHFNTSGKAVRCDFYQVTPTSGYGKGVMVGYFELNTNGALSYVAYPTARPVVQKTTFARNGNVNTFNYNTGLYGTYTLRATDATGLKTAPTNWPAITTLSSGDLISHTATDTTTDANRFYSITAQ
jgi:hypothetical protein